MANGFGPARNFRQRSWPHLREYNTLLKVASPIPESVLSGDRWLTGIDFDPASLLEVECWSPACDADDDWAANADDEAVSTTFLPVELRTSVVCSTVGLDTAELKDRVDANVAAKESARLTQLIVGTGTLDECWPNRTVAGLDADGDQFAADVGGGSVYGLDAAVARLEDAMALVLGDVLGTIWMTPGMLGLLNKGALVFEDGCWYTASGTAIVADGGVTGNGPDADDGLEPGPGDDFQWIYGSGPVWIHRGPTSYTPDVFASVDDGPPRVLPRNIVRFMHRRMAIAVFDPDTRWRIAAGYASSVFVA